MYSYFHLKVNFFCVYYEAISLQSFVILKMTIFKLGRVDGSGGSGPEYIRAGWVLFTSLIAVFS